MAKLSEVNEAEATESGDNIDAAQILAQRAAQLITS
jgi:hypothetical protein